MCSTATATEPDTHPHIVGLIDVRSGSRPSSPHPCGLTDPAWDAGTRSYRAGQGHHTHIHIHICMQEPDPHRAGQGHHIHIHTYIYIYICRNQILIERAKDTTYIFIHIYIIYIGRNQILIERAKRVLDDDGLCQGPAGVYIYI